MTDTRYRIIALGTIGLLLGGCLTIPDPADFAKHAVVVGSNGNLLVPDSSSFDPEMNSTDKFLELKDPKQFSGHFKKITDALKLSGKKKVLIYIHGGLNSLSKSTRRVGQKYLQVLADEHYFPIFINWDSGFTESYFEHLFYVRQGQDAPVTGPLTSPFYAIYDVGRSIVRAPITWGYTIYNDFGAPEPIRIEAERNADAVYDHVRTNWRISKGSSEAIGLNTVGNAVWYTVTWPFQFLFAPFVDGFGTSSWHNQVRRAKTVFERTVEFDVMGDAANVPQTFAQRQSGAVSVFFRALISEMGADHSKDYSITLIGHSMGVIIANEVLRRYPELPVDRVVYMAGADSIANTMKAVVPCLRKDKNHKLYILTLHPNNEKAEVNAWGFSPRGSLLVWLDNYFTTPETHMDRTLGR